MRLLLLGALAALLSGCVADAHGYLTAEECLEDRSCRREWRAEKRQQRADRRHRYVAHVRKRERRDLDAIVPSRDRGALCQREAVVATGERAQSEENAQVFALRIWRGQVAFRYGESYTNFDIAQHPRVHCAPVGIADTIGGKLREKLLGVTHWRCELSARPCRGRPETVERD